jgi:RNA polymerase sigma factor (sigma-70 family)
MLRTGFYCSLWSQGPQDAEDRIHDVFLQTVKAVRAGQLREPERLPGFVATIARRVAAQEVERRANTRRRTADIPQMDWLPDGRPDQETSLAEREELEVVRRVLSGLKPWERELLTRFYIREESPAQIQAGMGLSPGRYRVDKSRTLKRFAERGQAMLCAVAS